MDLYHFVGICGVVLYLLAYALLQVGILRGSGYPYTLLNMSAAGCVLVSLAGEFNLSSFLIQVSWIVISIVGLLRIYLHERRISFDANELSMAEVALPHLPRVQLRRFLDRGSWVRLSPDSLLTRQGDPVENLTFIADGAADVFRDGQKVATVQSGAFIGEMTCLTGDAATASVILTESTLCFRVPASALRDFVANDPVTLAHLERSFCRDMRDKLDASSRTVVGLASVTHAA